jgi:hypothetical protein
MTNHVPLRCAYSCMAQFPAATNKVVLLNNGAYPSFGDYLNETWQFTGTDWSNQSASTINSLPLPCRVDAATEYDGSHVVLFGGRGGSSTAGVFQDTWTYSTAGVWALQSPTTVPFGRYGHKLAYLSGTGTVMFGGRTINDLLLETWIWSGTNWSQVSVANGAGPAARVGHAMAGGGGNVVLFGGRGTNSEFGDTWTFASNTWTSVSPTGGVAPAARTDHAMAYAAAGTSFVMFGGKSTNQYFTDTWVFNAGTSTWTQITGSGPSGRVGAQMAYDATSSKVILFGGFNATTNYPANDTWAFDAVGLTWTLL